MHKSILSILPSQSLLIPSFILLYNKNFKIFILYTLTFTVLNPDNHVHLQIANIVSWIISVALRVQALEHGNPSEGVGP